MTVLELVGALWLGPQRPGQLGPLVYMASSLTCWMPALGGSGGGHRCARALIRHLSKSGARHHPSWCLSDRGGFPSLLLF